MSHLLLKYTGVIRAVRCSPDQQILRAASSLAAAALSGANPVASGLSTNTSHLIGSGSAATTETTTRGLATGYLAQKKAAKERRRELFEAREARKERIKTRRSGKTARGQKRQEFRSWFIPKKVDEEYMSRKARQAGLDWKIRVAVVLERTNVVLPDQDDWEVEFENLRGHLMQFGKQYPKELFPAVDYDGERAVTQEELLALLPKGFVPAPRETEADKSGDVRTTNRKLKTSIFLAVLEGDDDNKEDLWQFPTVDLKDDETLLEAAKRAIPETVGDEIEFWCLSNCPVAVNMVAFPEEARNEGFYGTKTFFLKIGYDEGDVVTEQLKSKDYAWLDRNEMVDRVKEQQGDYESKFYWYLL